MDDRVLDELLGDEQFLESLLEQGVEIEGSDDAGGPEMKGGIENPHATEEPSEAGSRLVIAGERHRSASDRQNSVYESATMQMVEELQETVRGLLAKVSAVIESAGATDLLTYYPRGQFFHAPNGSTCCIVLLIVFTLVASILRA